MEFEAKTNSMQEAYSLIRDYFISKEYYEEDTLNDIFPTAVNENSGYEKISDAVKRDMDYSRNYWSSKEGRAEKVMTTMNDNYLKANNQIEGIRSYNLVVRLLLSEYKDLKDKTH